MVVWMVVSPHPSACRPWRWRMAASMVSGGSMRCGLPTVWLLAHGLAGRSGCLGGRGCEAVAGDDLEDVVELFLLGLNHVLNAFLDGLGDPFALLGDGFDVVVEVFPPGDGFVVGGGF